MIQVQTDSTNIRLVEYDKEAMELLVTFHRGGKYKYSNVPLMAFVALTTSDSVGQAFSKHIKDKYPTEKQ